MTRSRTTLGITLAAATLLLAPLAACSASGDGDDTSATTTTAAGGTTVPGTDATTEPDGTTTTTDPGNGSDAPSLEELEDALPEAEDIGPVWTEVPTEKGDGINGLVAENCPEVAEYIETDDSEEVARTYQDEDGFEIQIAFDRELGPFASEDDLDTMLDAYNGCDASFTDEGVDYEVSFSASTLDSLGDLGVALDVEISLDTGDQQATLHSYQWGAVSSNGVLVSVATQDHMDGNYEVTPVNHTGVAAEFPTWRALVEDL